MGAAPRYRYEELAGFISDLVDGGTLPPGARASVRMTAGPGIDRLPACYVNLQSEKQEWPNSQVT